MKRSHVPRLSRLAATINGALDRLIADGTVERIYTRYGVDYRKP